MPDGSRCIAVSSAPLSSFSGTSTGFAGFGSGSSTGTVDKSPTISNTFILLNAINRAQAIAAANKAKRKDPADTTQDNGEGTSLTDTTGSQDAGQETTAYQPVLTSFYAPLAVSSPESVSLPESTPSALSPQPAISGAAATGMFSTTPAANTNVATWTPQGDSTDVRKGSGNWSVTPTKDHLLVFDCGGTVTTTESFNQELLATDNTGSDNCGIKVTNNTNVSMSTSSWLCMVQVDQGSSLVLTLNGQSFKTPGNDASLASVANVIVNGNLTLNSPGICVVGDWKAHDQRWFIGDQGSLTLTGDITNSYNKAQTNTWHIQKQIGSEASAALGSTIQILTITGTGNALTKLTGMRDSGLLDIQVYDSTGTRITNADLKYTASGVSAYIYNDLVWSGTETAWTDGGHGVYANGDATQTDTAFHNGDQITFNRANDSITVSGTIQAHAMNILENTTFSGGTIQAGNIDIACGKTMAVEGGNLTLDATSKVSGTGTLSLTLATTTTDLNVGNAATFAGFTGTIELHQGRLALGSTWDLRGGGINATLGNGSTLKVYRDASFQLSLGGSGKTFASNVWTENGSHLRIQDGHAGWSGDLHINELGLEDGATVPSDAVTELNMFYAKTHTMTGVVSGGGKFKFITTSGDGDNKHELVLDNNDNTFSGTYELAGSAHIGLTLSQQNAAKDAKVLMTSSYTSNDAAKDVGLIINTSAATIAGLATATDGTGKYRVYGRGNGSHVLTINQADDSAFTGVFQNGAGTLGLIKDGEGKLTLNGDNTATGALTVQGGTLALNGDNTHWTSTTVKDGATLSLAATSTFGTVNVESGGTLALAATSSWYQAGDDAGTVALATGGFLKLADSYTDGQTFDLSAVINGNKLTGFTADSVGGLIGRQTATFDANNVVTINAGALELVWGGGATGTWNTTKTNTPWEGTQFFADADSVTFNTADANVTIEGEVAPGSMTVGAATTFSGTGTATVAGTLTATANINITDGATLSANTLTLGNNTVTLEGEGSTLEYRNQKFEVSARTDLEGDLKSTVKLTGDAPGLWPGATISNAVVTLTGFRHIQVALENCDLITDTNSSGGSNNGTRLCTNAHNLHSLTVRGNTWVETNLDVADTLSVATNKVLEITNGTTTLHGAATVDGRISVSADKKMILADGASMLVNGTVNGAGTLEIDMTGRIANADAIVNNVRGSVGITNIALTNYRDLADGTYNLFQTSGATEAAGIMGKLNISSLYGDKQFDLSETAGLVKLTVEALTSRTVTTGITWYHDIDLDTSFPVTVTGADGRITLSKNAGTEFGASSHVSVGDVTLTDGGTFEIALGLNVVARTISKTDKPVIDSLFTLGPNATLQTDDGSWYFSQGLKVTGDSTVINKWDKGIVYDAINGGGTPEDDRGTTLSFKPQSGSTNDQVITFAADGDFGGTVELFKATAMDGVTGPNHYVIDATDAFQNAEVKLVNGAELRFDVATADIRKLSGNGSLLANNSEYGGNYTGETTLNVAETSSFTGTIGKDVNLAMGAGAGLTLTDSTLAGTVTGSDLTLAGTLVFDLADYTTAAAARLNATGTLNLDALTAATLSNYGSLGVGDYNLVQTSDANAEALLGKLTKPAYTETRRYNLSNNNGSIILNVGIINDLVWANTVTAWEDQGHGFYVQGDDNRTDTIFQQGDRVHFDTNNATVDLGGTLESPHVYVEKGTNFTEGTIKADAFTVSADTRVQLTRTVLETTTGIELVGGTSSAIYGNGTIIANLATPTSEWNVNNLKSYEDFHGTIEMRQGRLTLGGTWEHGGQGTNAMLGTGSTIKIFNGAAFQLSLGGSDKTFASNLWTENGVTVTIRDGHATWTHDVHINELGLEDGEAVPADALTTLHMHYGKTHTWNGVVSGGGTLKFTTGQNDDNNPHKIVLTNDSNTFSGTYELAGSHWQELEIAQTNAASDAKIHMTGNRSNANIDKNIALVISSHDAVISGLSSNGNGKYVVKGNGVGEHILTLNDTEDATFTGTFRDGNGGPLSLNKSGNAALTLNGDNTATGALNLNAGSLTLTGDNSGWSSISVKADTKLTLNNVDSISYNDVTNFGTIAYTGTGTISGQVTYQGTGALGFETTADVTIAADMSAANIAYNHGTLTLTGAGAVNTAGLDNTNGTINVGNTTTLSGVNAGTVNVLGSGALTLGGNNLCALSVAGDGTLAMAEGSTWQGALNLDLDNATLGKAVRADLTSGTNTLDSLSITNYRGLAAGTYDLLQLTSQAAAEGYTSLISENKYSLVANNGLLQLVVQDIPNFAKTLYTWSGTTTGNDMSAGKYTVTNYVGGAATLSGDDVLQGWDGAAGSGTQTGKTVKATIANNGATVTDDTEALASLRFIHRDAEPNGQNLTTTFTPIVLGSIIVEEGATGYSISQNGTGRHFYLGSTMDSPMQTIINEDFAVTMTNVHLRGKETITVAEGKTLALNAATTVRGKQTIDGAGTVTIGGDTTLQNGATLTQKDGFVKLATGKSLKLDGGSEYNMEGGALLTSYLLLHDINGDNGTTDTFNISGGEVTVTAEGNDENAAAVVVGQRAGGTGTLNVTGGVLNVIPGRLMIGYSGKGNLSITGGEVNAQTLDVRGNMLLGGDGRLNLGTGGLVKGGGSNSITITGGTLGTLTTAGSTMNQNATLAVAEGDKFTIDTQQRNKAQGVPGAAIQTENAGTITISGALSGSGDIEKVGLGKLILSGANTATGNLYIRKGELEFQNGGATGWYAAFVDEGATLTLAASNTRANIKGITNNGTLNLASACTLLDDQIIDGTGVLNILNGGSLTTGCEAALGSLSAITVNAGASLNMANGFVHDSGMSILNAGSMAVGGNVSLYEFEKFTNNGTINVAANTVFDLDSSWEAVIDNHAGARTKTIDLIGGTGTLTGGYASLNASNFSVGGVNLAYSDHVRAASIDANGTLHLTYWDSQDAEVLTEDVAELVLHNNQPELIVVQEDTNITLGSLTTDYTEDRNVISYTPGEYSLTKKGAGTLTIMDLPSNEIDQLTVIGGKVVLGDAGAATTQQRTVDVMHYEEVAAGETPTSSYLFVLDEKTGVYVPATDEQIADASVTLYTRSLTQKTFDMQVPGADGTEVAFNIGGSRIISTGGTLENVDIDRATRRISNVKPDAPAVLTDVQLRLGNIINNDTSLTNVQFAGNSALSGFVTIDQAGDNDKGAGISVAAGSTLTMGTPTNDKLGFNFMRGTITDHGADGTATVWDHHLIDLGQDATILNWDENHVLFYYEGVRTKDIISIAPATDTNDHLGVAHIDTDKAPELLWNGTGTAWNPTNATSTAWYTGTKEAPSEANGYKVVHNWTEEASRFYALSNVHFHTLDEGKNSNVQLGRDLTVLNFTIGGRVDDSKYGDTNWDGHKDGVQTVPAGYYNETAYTFSSGGLHVLRDLYIRSAEDITFANTTDIEAQRIFLYNQLSTKRMTFGGSVTTDYLTIGQTGIDSDCFGQYIFGGAVNVAKDLYIHVDSDKQVSDETYQVTFNQALTVGGDTMISGIGSKLFKGAAVFHGDLTVSNCRYNTEGASASMAMADFANLFTLDGDLIIMNGAEVHLNKTGSTIAGAIQVEKGTFTITDGMKGSFTNGGKGFTFELLGDEGTFYVTPNTYGNIASLSSVDEDGQGNIIDHDFTIAGFTRGTDINAMSHIKDLNITGGDVTITNTAGNVQGIHGNLTLGSGANIWINASDVFTQDMGEEHADNAHILTVGGNMTLAAGTRQLLTDGSEIRMEGGMVLAPRTNSAAKATVAAQGDLDLIYSSDSTFGANISVAAAEDGDTHTLTLRDTADSHDSTLYLSGAITAGENAVVQIEKGTHVWLEQGGSISGDLVIKSDYDDRHDFLNSALTVTREGQITDALITVQTGAALNVIANTPVTLDTLVMQDYSALALAALTGTKDLMPELSCLKVTNTAQLGNGTCLYFQDELETMTTYAILTLTNNSLTSDQLLTQAMADKINICTRNLVGEDTYADVPLGRDQYELKVSEDGRTLYLTTFFGMIWDGGTDGNGNGVWSTADTDKNWTNKDWTDNQTAIFRDLGEENNRLTAAEVTLRGDIRTTGIFVTSNETNYTFTGDGTTLLDDHGDAPELTKNGTSTLTINDFGEETFGTIDVHQGKIVLQDSTIDYTDKLVVSEEGELRINSGSTLTGHMKVDGTDTVAGTISAAESKNGTAILKDVTAEGKVLTTATDRHKGQVSGAAVSGYTLTDIELSGSNTLTGTTIDKGVSVRFGGDLTLAGDTVFDSTIANDGTISLADGATVDVGNLTFGKSVDTADNSSRTHTYTLFTPGSTGGFVYNGNLFNSDNVKIHGAAISKYNSDFVYVSGYSAQDGTITLTLNGVETPQWDPAWGIADNKSPWLGHLITGDMGKVDATGNYTHYDNDATSATEGTYRYYNLLADGVNSNVSAPATSIVLSQFLTGKEDKIFAAGDGLYANDVQPSGDVWVYDKGSSFGTKIAGYYITKPGFTVHDMVTHMVLEAPDGNVTVARVVGGSQGAATDGVCGTYLTINGGNYTEVIGGNVSGGLAGDTHVYVHDGVITDLFAGSYGSSEQYKAGAKNVYVLMDGGRVTNLYGNGATGQVNGDIVADLTAGQLHKFTTEGTVTGDVTVNLTSDLRLVSEGDDLSYLKGVAGAGHTATLNIINNNPVGDDGTKAEVNLSNTHLNGFDVINIGSDTVRADVRYFMDEYTGNVYHDVRLTGKGGRFILDNGHEGTNGAGRYHLYVSEGLTLALETSYIHLHNSTGDYPTIIIEDGATFDISGEPVTGGGGISINLEISGHGMDGKGALVKNGNVGLKPSLVALPCIKVTGNTSFGGAEGYVSDYSNYGKAGYVDLYDADGETHNHTLTKCDSSTWQLQRITFKGGTLNIIDTSTIQTSKNTSSSPWQGNKRAASSTTDVVIGQNATLHVDSNNHSDDGAYNNFSVRSLSGDGTVLLSGSELTLYTDGDVTDFYDEFKDSNQKYWNSEGYTYSVFSGTILDDDTNRGNKLIKAGSGTQYLSGSESTYDGTTRILDGELYLLGTSYGTMVKNSSTPSQGVIGTSEVEWGGGVLTLGDDVRIYNKGQAISGAAATGGVSDMVIRVHGDTTDTYQLVLEDTLELDDGSVWHKVETKGVHSIGVDGVYADGTKYEAGHEIATNKGGLYVNKAAGSMVDVDLIEKRYDAATYSGVLSDAADGNKGRLVKEGKGTLTIDQYNAYTGGTYVKEGTLNVQGWGLLGGTSSAGATQDAGSSFMLSYDGQYGADECFFINTPMEIHGTGDIRWKQETETVEGKNDGYTAALISNVGTDFNANTIFTLAGTISGNGNVLHMGEGTLYIDGWKADTKNGVTSYIHDSDAAPNTYTGGTTVTNGKVYVRKDAGLGATADGLDANLVTLTGTEVHFEDCNVTLSAIETKDGTYSGNSIEGKIVIGTPDGTIRGTGAKPDNGTMQPISGTSAVDPTEVIIQGTGYWAESTKIDQDGSLVFQGGAATNCSGRLKDPNTLDSRTRAGYLEGTGNLVLDNDGRNGALAVTFSDIGNGTDGFQGNIYVQGKNAALFFDDGDFDASKNNVADSGNIVISGENVGIVARDSNITISSGDKLVLSSNNDAWKLGKTTYEVENGIDGAPERAGAAAITAQSVTIVGGATLEVIRGHESQYDVDDIDAADLNRLKQASTLTVDNAAALGAGIDTWGDTRPDADHYRKIVERDLTMTQIMQDYDRVFTPDGALNTASVGVIDTGDIASGPLRLAAGSNLVLKNSSLNLSDSALHLQAMPSNKINLSLEFGQITYTKEGYPSQIVLFTDVDDLYISEAAMLSSATRYTGTGEDVYVFQANQYFQNCWQITDDTLLVYDTKARVIYLDYAVPEPTTGALSVLALAALAARRRRRATDK